MTGKLDSQIPNKISKAEVRGFRLRPINVEHLQAISQGNMSFTIRKLIEDAWKLQSAKETK